MASAILACCSKLISGRYGSSCVAGGLVAVLLPGPDAGDERLRVGEAGHGAGGAGHELVQQPLAAEAAEDGNVDGGGQLARWPRLVGGASALTAMTKLHGLHHGDERLRC